MLKIIDDKNEFKKRFKLNFQTFLNSNIQFKEFLLECFVHGPAYVVGGYIRDIANDEKPRDIDLIIQVNPELISDFLLKSNLDYKINRLGGVKVNLSNFEVDLWSIQNNWAFKMLLVKQNPDDILNSISNGCFYNFDSLVVNVIDSSINVRNYNNCIENNQLDILQKNISYQKLNPTVEANLLRAFYINSRYGLSFSLQLEDYITRRLGHINDLHCSALDRLLVIKQKYPKYEKYLLDSYISEYVNRYINRDIESNLPNQGRFNF